MNRETFLEAVETFDRSVLHVVYCGKDKVMAGKTALGRIDAQGVFTVQMDDMNLLRPDGYGTPVIVKSWKRGSLDWGCLNWLGVGWHAFDIADFELHERPDAKP